MHCLYVCYGMMDAQCKNKIQIMRTDGRTNKIKRRKNPTRRNMNMLRLVNSDDNAMHGDGTDETMGGTAMSE